MVLVLVCVNSRRNRRKEWRNHELRHRGDFGSEDNRSRGVTQVGLITHIVLPFIVCLHRSAPMAQEDKIGNG